MSSPSPFPHPEVGRPRIDERRPFDARLVPGQSGPDGELTAEPRASRRETPSGGEARRAPQARFLDGRRGVIHAGSTASQISDCLRSALPDSPTSERGLRAIGPAGPSCPRFPLFPHSGAVTGDGPVNHATAPYPGEQAKVLKAGRA